MDTRTIIVLAEFLKLNFKKNLLLPFKTIGFFLSIRHFLTDEQSIDVAI